MRRHLAAVVFCCAVASVVAAMPQAASVRETAALALIAPSTRSYSDDPADIVLVDAEGRVVFDLTTATGGVTGITKDREFAWSPDGNQIAFVREEATGPNRIGRVLYVADVDGGHLRRLGEGDEPSWSPDGRRIAFVQQNSVVTAASDGIGLHTIAATVSSPRDSSLGLEWSPDGFSLLYRCQHTTSGTAFGVCLADPDGNRPSRTVWQSATARVLGASFSPDSRSIAVMADSGLDTIDSTTGQVRWHNALSSRFYFTPVWSPDGSQIAFTGYVLGGCCVGRGAGDWLDIYVINADGTGLRRLTGVRDRPLQSSPSPGPTDGRLEPASFSPVWWPDRSRLFFAREQRSTIAGKLFMMNADGTCETPFVLDDVPVRPDAAPPNGPTWRPSTRLSPPPLNCVDLALAPVSGEDTPTTLQYPHIVVHDVVPYTITIKNDGTQAATGLELEIRVGGSERVLVAPGRCARLRVTITCRLPNELAPGGENPVNLRAEATLPSGARGRVSVHIRGREGTLDPDTSNNRVAFTIWVRPKRIAGEFPFVRIEGTDADETLFGRPGGDVILGRGGNDLIYAGDGNDLIYGGDGRDVIHCGRGNDTVYADRDDIIARDCEHIRRLP